MKGIVFNLLEEVVNRQLSADVWDDLLDGAGLDGAYTSLGNYSDEEIMKLVAVAAQALQLSPDEVVCWFGRHALPLMVEKYPQFFVGHTSTREFLLTLNGIIHPEVLKLYPGADTPEFAFDHAHDQTLIMEYKSHRSMCSFAEGLMEGCAVHFQEAITIAHPSCKKRGDAQCVFHLSFVPSPHY